MKKEDIEKLFETVSNQSVFDGVHHNKVVDLAGAVEIVQTVELSIIRKTDRKLDGFLHCETKPELINKICEYQTEVQNQIDGLETQLSDIEYKRADARTSLEVNVHCPYCNHFQDIIDNVRESLGEDLTITGIEHEITCEGCGQIFIVDNVVF